MTRTGDPPGDREFELTLLGPGYGESIVMHLGGGKWAVVDSCLDFDETPGALRYLESLGADPAQAVVLIVATHWHDDHIRGMARLVESSPNARFCCASALCREEFLALVGAVEGHHFSASGSGLRELHGVFSWLVTEKTRPIHALANRVVFREEACTIWSLSPGDEAFQRFLASVGRLISGQGENKRRLRDLSPNEVSVALRVDAGNFALLLGADLESRGWIAVLEDPARPAGRASVFKVPHHGSENAHEPAVWDRMLEPDPVAVLTPWRRGGRVLPTARDAERLSRATPNAWITNTGLSGQPVLKHENRTVDKTLRESGVRIRRLTRDRGAVRLRRSIDADDRWTVETFGNARRLIDYAA